MKPRIRHQEGTAKGFVLIYLTLPLDAVITIPYILFGGHRRYDENTLEQYPKVLPRQIVDEALRELRTIPCRQALRDSYADIWRRITQAPVLLANGLKHRPATP